METTLKKISVVASPQVQPTIHAIILEDEPANMELLQTLLERHCSNVKLTGTGESIADGVKLINDSSVKVDVVFLDIRLSDGLAFEMFRFLNKVTFDVIFVTAWDEYFKQACNYYSIGYILKPIDPADLVAAVGKVRHYSDPKEVEEHNLALKGLIAQTKNPQLLTRFPIPTSKGFSFVDLKDIIRLEGFDNYTKIYTKHETLMTSRTIKVFEKVLEPLNFHRIHKQHIVNLANVKQYLRTDSYVEMSDGNSLPVAKRRKASFLKILRDSPFV